MKINIELLQKMIEEKFVSVQKHPEADLYIYNYTQKAQYSQEWNEITLQCRGLIMDSEYNIIQRPFKKFFNIDEHDPKDIPHYNFEVYTKMDGSLGILYWIGETPYIATRGSFESDQAIHATNILHSKYKNIFNKIDRSRTYLFEIIYPENRIVVNYGWMDDLVLLAILDTQSGTDIPLEDIGFSLVTKYDGIRDIQQLREIQEENAEGFVIKFLNGFRVKLYF